MWHKAIATRDGFSPFRGEKEGYSSDNRRFSKKNYPFVFSALGGETPTNNSCSFVDFLNCTLK